jgi:hypothetical protein
MRRFSTLVYWLLSAGLFCLVAKLMIDAKRRMELKMQISGTEHILAMWQDSIEQFEKELGPADDHLRPWKSEEFRDAMMIATLSLWNVKKKTYLDADATPRSNISPCDAWGGLIILDPESTGQLSNVVSKGPDGILNTADDLDSRKARRRKIAMPQE